VIEMINRPTPYRVRIPAGSPNTTTQTSEATDWEAARQEFGDKVRRDQVRHLRRETVPAKWPRQGRRRKAAK
jgi:hypothetical protein